MVSLLELPPPTPSDGYASADYVESVLKPHEEVVTLRQAQTRLIRRPVPGRGTTDLTSPYPLLMCGRWEALAHDLLTLESADASVVAVIDPLAASTGTLSPAFPDWLVPFKEHALVDLAGDVPPSSRASTHHRRNLRRALRALRVVTLTPEPQVLRTWTTLYRSLISRHGATGGPSDFIGSQLSAQFCASGMIPLGAIDGSDIVGITLWLTSGNFVYYHLGAFSDAGYRSGAAFALFAVALDSLAAAGYSVANLGGGAGIDGTTESGLLRFKRGWATRVEQAMIGGRIVDRDAFAQSGGGFASDARFFPPYRAAPSVGVER